MLPSLRFKVLILLLSTASSMFAEEIVYDDDYETSQLDKDADHILPLESSNSEVTVAPDDIAAQESKDTVAFTKDQTKKPTKFKIKLQNVTEEKYNFVQWYSEPADVSHHVGDIQRTTGESLSKATVHDLNAQSSSYEEGYHEDHDHYHADEPRYPHYEDDSKQRHHDSKHHDHDGHHPEPEHSVSHYHHDHDGDHYHYDHGDAHVHSFHHKGGNSGEEKSEKRKMRKIKKKCPKSEARYPGSADTIVHSLSKSNGPEISHYDTRVQHGRFSPSVLPLLAPSGLTGPHLHSMPRAQYFKQKTSEKGNHIHLHNHHHHYNAEGKRINLHNEPSPTGVQGYGNLMKSLGKLRSLLPLALAGMAGKQNLGLEGFQQNQGHQGYQQNQEGQRFQQPQISEGVHLPTENGVPDVKLAAETPKKGYHYTGPYKSYGRKTYYRMKNGESNPSSSSGETSGPGSFGYGSGESSQDVAYPNEGSYNIVEDMLKYGTGPYATDEFNEDGGERHYPNEVSLGVDRDPPQGEYSDSHSNTGYSHSDSHSPNSYSQSDVHAPNEYNQSHGGHTSGYHDHPSGHYDHPTGHHDPPPRHHDHPSEDYDSGLNHEQKNSPDYEEKAPYVPYDQIEANRAKEGGYGLRQNSPHPSDISYEDKANQIIKELGPMPVVPPPSDSVSYSQDGVDQHFYDPEKDYMYRDLKPEPDPLSIPKNARVIEHHIRLHPMHYTMFSQIPLDLEGGRNAFPTVRQQHIPMHKLIPNPLKMPGAPPVAAHHPNPQLNDMLHAYQSRNVYHRWW